MTHSDGKLDLLPCRRCQQLDAEVFANDGWYTVECNNCPCRTSGADRTAVDAVAAWNRPPAGAGEVVVKALNWKTTGPQGEQEVAFTGFPERYVVTRHSISKAAAQADYEQRIRSALAPVPTNTVDGAVALLPEEIAERYERAIAAIRALPDDAPHIDLLADVVELAADLADIARKALFASPDTTSRASVIEECASIAQDCPGIVKPEQSNVDPFWQGVAAAKVAIMGAIRALSTRSAP